MNVTKEERIAAQETDSTITSDTDVLQLEELAALYVASAGSAADPRAVDLFNAAKKAGRINEQGEFIGDSADDNC